ncbi:MAG: hypothetical protein QW279_10990 [Candidatus Jordarchaeaceae archaeon]
MHTIDYRSLLKGKNRRSVLEGLTRAGGMVRFNELHKIVEIPKSSLEYTLTVLEKRGIIKRESGSIRLQYTTPLCYLFDSPSAYAYLGLLGEKSEREESETETAINLLEGKGFKFERKVVATTHGAVAEWENIAHLNIDWCLLSDEEISRVNMVKEKLLPRLIELVKNYKVVMDCTSATKPATIAYYQLAAMFKVPLIYVYEKRRELIWIVSVEDLKKELLSNAT